MHELSVGLGQVEVAATCVATSEEEFNQFFVGSEAAHHMPSLPVST